MFSKPHPQVKSFLPGFWKSSRQSETIDKGLRALVPVSEMDAKVDLDSAEPFLDDTTNLERKRPIHQRAFLIGHGVIAFVWIAITLSKSLCLFAVHDLLWPDEIPFAAEAVAYETVIFDNSGIGTRANPTTRYEGPPTPEKDLLWWQLSDVGIFALTPGQDAATNYPTVAASLTDDTPLIQIEVFHQLHCLNAIRQQLYRPANPKTPAEQVEVEVHIDHCVDYLRQVLMCHADLTPIMHVPRSVPHNPVLPSWKPSFTGPHTCRNFQKIHDWAAKYNTSGWSIAEYPGRAPWASFLERFMEEHENGKELIAAYESTKSMIGGDE